MDELLIRGILALGAGVVVLVGSGYLLLSLILGWRMGYLVLGSVFSAIMVLLSIIWFLTALGPKGPETRWEAVAVGQDLASVKGPDRNYDVTSYPGGEWVVPGRGEYLADLKGSDDLASQAIAAEPVLETLVSASIDPEKRESVAQFIQGDVGLKSGEFELVDLRVQETIVDEKPSLISLARAVPSERVLAGPLGGAEEGEIESYLVKAGDEITAGTPIATVKTEAGSVTLLSATEGKVISTIFKAGDKMREGTTLAFADITGRPGAPAPVEVAAVRIRGAVRIPALISLIAFSVLFAIHLLILDRTEKAQKAVPQAA